MYICPYKGTLPRSLGPIPYATLRHYITYITTLRHCDTTTPLGISYPLAIPITSRPIQQNKPSSSSFHPQKCSGTSSELYEAGDLHQWHREIIPTGEMEETGLEVL